VSTSIDPASGGPPAAIGSAGASGDRRLRVAVLLSGRGSNLKALIDGAAHADASYRLVGAFSDRREAPGLSFATAADIPTAVFEPKSFTDKASYEAALFAAVELVGAELVVLAGYMRIVSAASVAAWHGRLINIHPSLLPAYPGLDTHARVLRDGGDLHGASVHYVTAVLDAGPVLMQVQIAIDAGDTPETIAARLLPCEHALLLAAVKLIAQGRVTLDRELLRVDGQLLAAPLLLACAGPSKGIVLAANLDTPDRSW